MPIRALGDDGSGSVDNVARGIDYAAHPRRPRHQPLAGQRGAARRRGGGRQRSTRPSAARSRPGIVVVAAAGNNARAGVREQPAAGDGPPCVGAVDKRRQRSFFSSFGRGLGLVAPGGSGASPAGWRSARTSSRPFAGSTYRELAGTSQAAPHVAGRRRAARGARRARAGRGRSGILATASDLGPPGDDARVRRGPRQRARRGGGARRRRRADRLRVAGAPAAPALARSCASSAAAGAQRCCAAASGVRVRRGPRPAACACG